MQCNVRATCQETRTPGGRKVKRELEGCLAHCSAQCTPGGVEGGRGQRDRRPETLQPRKRGRGGWGRTSGQGARQGQGAGAERGGGEGGLPRKLLRTVLALAGGQRVRGGSERKGACCGGYSEALAGGYGACQGRAPRGICLGHPRQRLLYGSRSCGGCGGGGRPQRGAAKFNDTDGRGQVRACNMRANCLLSVLHSVRKGKGQGREGRQGAPKDQGIRGTRGTA